MSALASPLVALVLIVLIVATGFGWPAWAGPIRQALSRCTN